jgi:3-oxoacyl-[acyl-carrier protein] reductase
MSTYIVTGGASGLGAAITRKLARIAGNRIYFTFCRSEESARKLEGEFTNATALFCDFSKSESLDSLIAQLPGLGLDGIVNNALPSLERQHFHKTKSESFSQSFEVNVLPTLRITQAAIKEFRKKKAGRIVTVLTSYLLNRPPVGLSVYVANKAYLESASKSWATENTDYNITSNAVSPSLMLTGLTSNIDERILEELLKEEPSGRFLTVDEVSEAIAFLLSCSPGINGVNLPINSGRNVV